MQLKKRGNWFVSSPVLLTLVSLTLSLTLSMSSGSLALASVSGPEGSLPNYLPGTCIYDANDPFEPNVQMESGPLKGLCVNPLQRRSAQILSPKVARKYFSQTRGSIVIANFSHQGRFWIAQIPIEQAKSVTLQVEYFPILKMQPVGELDIAHVQFRFQFEDGAVIRLKPQNKSTTTGTPSIAIKEMIFSVENIGPYGEKFDSVKGLKGNYHIAYRAVSLSDKYEWMITEQGHKVTQSRVLMSPDQVQALLGQALSRATQYSTRRPYNTIRPNCSTELFNLIDETLGLQGYDEPFYPNLSVGALAARGLLDTSVILPTLGEEF